MVSSTPKSTSNNCNQNTDFAQAPFKKSDSILNWSKFWEVWANGDNIISCNWFAYIWAHGSVYVKEQWGEVC